MLHAVRRNKILFVCLVGIIILLAFRKKDLHFFLAQEISPHGYHITLSMDGDEIYKGDVAHIVGNRLVVDDLNIGMHRLEMRDSSNNSIYDSNQFFLLNFTMIFEISNDEDSVKVKKRHVFGYFLPD